MSTQRPYTSTRTRPGAAAQTRGNYDRIEIESGRSARKLCDVSSAYDQGLVNLARACDPGERDPNALRQPHRPADPRPAYHSRMDPAARLDLNLLHVLVALGDAGSVSRAAVRLGVSQPTVSAALGRLRAHFGDRLFVRAPGGMAPTPRGAEIVDAARDVLRKVDQTLHSAVSFDPALRHRPFSFALSDVGEMVFLPRLTRALAQRAPNTPVRSVSLRPDALDEALDGGDVDLAIGHFPDLEPPRYHRQLLFTHHFVCLLRADHPVQGRRLTMGEFLSLQHVVVQSEGRTQEILEAQLEAQGVQRRIALTQLPQ